MQIDARCSQHGVVGTGDHWSRVATMAAIHGCHGHTTVALVVTVNEYAVLGTHGALIPAADGRVCVRHRDRDDSTVLVPAIIGCATSQGAS
jgi:hypothetical protein